MHQYCLENIVYSNIISFLSLAPTLTEIGKEHTVYNTDVAHKIMVVEKMRIMSNTVKLLGIYVFHLKMFN